MFFADIWYGTPGYINIWMYDLEHSGYRKEYTSAFAFLWVGFGGNWRKE